MEKDTVKCPKCGQGFLNSRVKRPAAVKDFLFWLPLKRYKCNKCAKKTYMW